MVKKEISSDKHWKEAFCESAFSYIHSTHILEAFFTLRGLEVPCGWIREGILGITFGPMVKLHCDL